MGWIGLEGILYFELYKKLFSYFPNVSHCIYYTEMHAWEKALNAPKRNGVEHDWTNIKAHIRNNQDQVKRRWRFLEKYLWPKMNLLEIGCSSGFMLNAFHDYGIYYTRIEPSGKFLVFLRQNKHIAYESLNELESMEHEKRFDIIVHFFVLSTFGFLLTSLSVRLNCLKQEVEWLPRFHVSTIL